MPQLIGDTREETRSKQRRCTMENRRQPPSDNLPPHCAAYVDIAGEDDETKEEEDGRSGAEGRMLIKPFSIKTDTCHIHSLGGVALRHNMMIIRRQWYSYVGGGYFIIRDAFIGAL